MQPVYRSYILLLLMATMLGSCGKNGDIARISALEERMSEVQDPTEKSELANRLHREYTLYHLENEKDTLFLMRWAKMAEQGREYEQAIEIYSMLLEREPDLTGVYATRARLHAGLGYYREASSDFNRAAELLPEEATETRAEYAQWSDFYYRADSVIRREGEFIAAGTDSWMHMLNRAAQYMKCGYYSAAVADIRPVLESDSMNSRAYYLLARTYMASGEYERSMQEFEMYFSRSTPEEADYSEAQRQQQRLVQLIRLRDLEQELRSEPYAYEKLVEASAIAFRLENFNKAMTYATRLSAVFPDSIFGFLYRGQVGIRTGDLDQAQEDMNRVLELEPANISARNLKGYIFLLREDYDALHQEVAEINSMGGEVLEVLQRYSVDTEK